MADITAAQYDSFVSDWVSSNGGTIPTAGGNGGSGGVKANAAAAKEQGAKGLKLGSWRDDKGRGRNSYLREAKADQGVEAPVQKIAPYGTVLGGLTLGSASEDRGRGHVSYARQAAAENRARDTAPITWENVSDVFQRQSDKLSSFIKDYEHTFGEEGSGSFGVGADDWMSYSQRTQRQITARNQELRAFLEANRGSISQETYDGAIKGIDEMDRISTELWGNPYKAMLDYEKERLGSNGRTSAGYTRDRFIEEHPGQIVQSKMSQPDFRYMMRQQEINRARAEYAAAQQRLSDVDDKLTWGSSAFTPEEWEQLKQLRIDYSKQVQDAKAAMTQAEKAEDWEGRDELIQEYKQLQKEWLTAVQSATTPEEIREAEALGLQMQQVNEALQAGDRAAGNGERVYTWRDRAGNVLVGTAAGIVGSIGNAAITMADATLENRAYGDTEARLMDEQLDLNRAQLEQANRENPEFAVLSLPQGETEAEKRQRKIEAYKDPDRQAKWDRMYAWADTISESGQRDIQRAKEGLSQLGQIGVDIAQNMLEMGFDAGVGAITGGGSLASMFVRTFGSSAYEARKDGATLDEQVKYGGAKAIIEVATEKMFDGVAKIYGAGAADEVVEELIRKLADSPTGRSCLRMIAGAAGEGFEEVVSDLLSPLAERLYKNQSIAELYRQLDLSEILYDFFIGATVGILGSTTSLVNGQDRAANMELAMRDAGIGGVENQAAAAMDVLSGRVTPEQQQNRELRGTLAAMGYNQREINTAMQGLQLGSARAETKSAAPEGTAGINQANQGTVTPSRTTPAGESGAPGMPAANTNSGSGIIWAGSQQTGGGMNHAEAEQSQQGILGQEEAQPAAGGNAGQAGEADADAGRTAPGQPAGTRETGTSVSDGGGGRDAGARARGTAGQLDEQARRHQERRREQGQRAADRRRDGAALRERGEAQLVSARELGIRAGTEEANLTLIPGQAWDEEMREVERSVWEKTGYGVMYVLGPIQIQSQSGRTANVRGVLADGVMILQADHAGASVTQLADHESFHALAQTDPELREAARQKILERFTPEELRRKLDSYITMMQDGLLAVEGDINTQAELVMEELLADAYADINWFGLGAYEYGGAVREAVQERAGMHQAQGVQETRGPPEERYSFAGERAATADLEALDRAEEMEKRGVSSETIRQSTGWFRGMDGKWRFEIDDSGMQYYRNGDAQFRTNHPEYAEYQDLMGKILTGDFDQVDMTRLKTLDETYGKELPRLSYRVRQGNATLQNLIQHEALFEAYPFLRDIPVRFVEGLAEKGNYNAERNTIELRSDLADAPNSTLLHEIQHAIQQHEGFAAGSNPEAWEERLKNGYDGQGRNAYNLYRNTAGEIEARDVQARSQMDSEQRKKTPPNLGDEDVVFAEENTKTLSWDTDEEEIRKGIQDTVREAIQNKGHIDSDHNSKKFGLLGTRVIAMIYKASGIDTQNKKVSVNASDVWHEFVEHSDPEKEPGRGQGVMTEVKIADAIMSVFEPDVIEGLFPEGTNTHRKSFAVAKKTADGNYVVVEAVGGKNKPTIVPIQIIEIKENKWNTYQNAGKTLGEMLYENDPEKLSALDVAFIKKNRVIAAQFTSEEVIANTPHSPRPSNSILESSEKSNTNFAEADTESQPYSTDDSAYWESMPEDQELLRNAAARDDANPEVAAWGKKQERIETLDRKANNLREAMLEADSEEQAQLQTMLDKTEKQLTRAREDAARMENSPAVKTALDRERAAWRDANPTEAAAAMRSLQQENKAMQELVEYWKGQARRTTDTDRTVMPEDTRRLARSLLQEHGSEANTNRIADALQRLGNYMVSSDSNDLNFNRIMSEARGTAREIIDSAYLFSDASREIREEIRDYLRSTKLKISEELRGDTTDLADFRRRNMGTLRLANDGLDIDVAYMELADRFGEGLFPKDVTAHSDMLNQILNALERVQPSYERTYQKGRLRDEMVEHVANEIVDGLLSGDVRQSKTMADRQYEAMGKRNADLSEKNQELKDKLRGEKNMRRQLVQEKVSELRQRSVAKDKAYRKRVEIDRKVQRLSKYLTENSAKNHVPESLKGMVSNLLLSIDTLSPRSGEKARQDYIRRLNELERIAANHQTYMRGGENENGMFLDLPPELQDILQEHITSIQEAMDGDRSWTTARMDAQQLEDLDKIVSSVSKAITTANQLMADSQKGRVSDVAEQTIRDLDELGAAATSGMSESAVKAANFLTFQNTTPYYFFKKFGEGGKRIFRNMQEGWSKLAFHAQEIIDYSEKAYTAKEAKAAEGEVKEFKLNKRLLEQDGTENLRTEEKESVFLTKAQIMELYALSKRPQALGHMLSAGIRISDIQQDKGKGIRQADNFLLTGEELAEITGTLTDREKAIADTLQKYMNTVGSDWGNEVSMARFGFKQFTEENYWPIKTDSRSRAVRDPGADSSNLFRLLNSSFTKATVRDANNAIVIGSAFDTFANHMADMAKYNALGLPMLDAMKWFSYNTAGTANEAGQYTTTSVQKSAERAYGTEAQKYFTQFMKDMNGTHEGGRDLEQFGSRMLSNYKVAAVGANLRVALLQPTAYVRASAVLDPKFLVKGLGMSNKQGRAEAMKYSGTAVWKDLGFYDTNINNGLREMIKHTDSVTDTIKEKSMTAAEWGDKTTWGAIWNACKAQVQETRKLTGEELMKATSELFDEVIYRTQVMDSTMTRSHNMRQKGVFASMTTAFMAEPTLSYNMMLDAYNEFRAEQRKGGDTKTALRTAAPKVARSIAAYMATAAAAAIAESLMDAWQDDDKYQSYLEKWQEAMFGNGNILDGNLVQDLLIHNKLPFVKDIDNLINGYSSSRMDTEWMSNLVKTYQIWKETIQLANGKLEEPTKITSYGSMTWYGKIYQTLKTASQMSGLPMGNASREIASIWNNTIGALTGKLLQTYDSGDYKEIKYALKDGYLSDEEAVRYLMEQGVYDDESKARAEVYKWVAEKQGDKITSSQAQAVQALTESGSTAEEAVTAVSDIWQQIEELEPLAGTDKVTKTQRYSVVVNSDLSIDQQMSMLGVLMSESELEKTEAAYQCGITPQRYINTKVAMYAVSQEMSGDGSVSAEEAKAALDKMNDVTLVEKAVLWQMQNKSWKPAKNPYDTEIGSQVYAVLHGEGDFSNGLQLGSAGQTAAGSTNPGAANQGLVLGSANQKREIDLPEGWDQGLTPGSWKGAW